VSSRETGDWAGAARSKRSMSPPPECLIDGAAPRAETAAAGRPGSLIQSCSAGAAQAELAQMDLCVYMHGD
jgi:hypothetical protein